MSGEQVRGEKSKSDEITVIRPIIPYSITPHLSLFTIKGSPVPAIYERGEFRILLYERGQYIPLDAKISGEPWDARIRVRGPKELAKELFRADFDSGKFLESLQGYPRIRALAERYMGLRPTRSLDLYTALIETMIKQRISLKAALKIQSRIILSLGVRKSLDGQTYYGHPPPENLLDPERLRSFGLTRMKALALSEVAMVELEEGFPSLREVEDSPREVVEELQAIRGVGSWTAELAVAMTSKGFEIGPTSDLTVKRGLSRVLGIDSREEEVKKALRDLEEYAGLVMYLASLDHEVVGHQRPRT